MLLYLWLNWVSWTSWFQRCASLHRTVEKQCTWESWKSKYGAMSNKLKLWKKVLPITPLILLKQQTSCSSLPSSIQSNISRILTPQQCAPSSTFSTLQPEKFLNSVKTTNGFSANQWLTFHLRFIIQLLALRFFHSSFPLKVTFLNHGAPASS